MNTTGIKIYNEFGDAIVDTENDIFNVDGITWKHWSQIFGTDFEKMEIRDKNGTVRVSCTKEDV